MNKKLLLRGRTIWFVVFTICFAGAIAFFLNKGWLRLNYPYRSDYPIQGIDISHHQGEIDWKKLQSENLQFVFIKATEGGDFRDPRFHDNWKSARESGYVVGAYHFYRLCKSGKEQAEHMIAVVPDEPKSLPPAVDLEFGGNCEAPYTREEILREIQVCLETLRDHYKKVPVIYATREFYEAYLTDRFQEYPLWIRDIYSKPALPGKRTWTFWQYANRGHLDGIDGYVDLNVLNPEKKLKHLTTTRQ